MALQQCIITSGWSGTGVTGDEYRPWITDIFPATIVKWTDVTATPVDSLVPDPDQLNMGIIADELDMATIDADTRFVVLPGTLSYVPVEGDLLERLDRAFNRARVLQQAVTQNSDIETVPTQPEFVTYRNDLFAMETKGAGLTWTVGQLNQAIGALVEGRTWGEIHIDLNNFLKDL
jgi:hypothetical protein